MEKQSRDLQTCGRNFHKVMQKPEVEAETTNDSRGGELLAQLSSGNSSEGLTEIGIVAKKLEHITDFVTVDA
jgi:hypothetical protein